MSLINEALKKAQSDRPHAPKHLVASQLGGAGHPPPAPRKRNYLWGFLMSVIIVGLFSAGMSTFLVYYILGDEKPAAEAAQAKPVAAQVAQVEPVAEPLPAEAAPEPAPVPEKVSTPTGGTQAEPVLKEAPVTKAAPPPAVTPEVPPSATPPPPGPTNPAVWARLQELEIRGIMGGGTKVLVFDLSTGKTKSFVEGDLVDGPLGLQIVTLKPNAIVFKDYDGFEYTKSF